MADSTISQLPAALTISPVDFFAIDQGGVTKKATLGLLGSSVVFVAAGKIFTVNNTLTLAGTDGTTMTFPSTNASLARTDAAQSFAGLQTFTDGITTPAQVASTVATGSPPLVVASTTPVANLTTLNNALLAGSASQVFSGASATAAAHFVTKGQLNASSGADEIGFIQTGTGVNTRTLSSKDRDIYNVQDFYANGVSGAMVDLTGTVDSTVGLQNAFNASNTYGVPINAGPGTIKITAPIALPLSYQFYGAGNRQLTINQATANTSGFTSTSTGALSQQHSSLSGFTLQGAGIGTGISTGISLGLSGKSSIDCKINDISVNSFGLKGVELINQINADVKKLYVYNNGTYGLYTLGELAVPGSNAFNNFDMIWSYNHSFNVFCSVMTESILRRLYLYQDASFATLTHQIWLQNCLLNRITKADIQPQALAVANALDASGSTASVLIEATAAFANEVSGNVIERSMFGMAGTFANDAIQLGTAAGKVVYNSTVENNEFINLPGGKAHVNMLNESASSIRFNEARATTWGSTATDIVLNNPNGNTNNSPVYMKDLESWTATMTASTSGTITLSAATGTAFRAGHTVTISGQFAVSAISAPVGDLYINNLPYRCKSGAQYDVSVTVWAESMAGTAATELQGRIDNNTTSILIRRFAAGVAAACAGDVQATTVIRINATYFV